MRAAYSTYAGPNSLRSQRCSNAMGPRSATAAKAGSLYRYVPDKQALRTARPERPPEEVVEAVLAARGGQGHLAVLAFLP